jgi:Bacterial membrane protein YfhO
MKNPTKSPPAPKAPPQPAPAPAAEPRFPGLGAAAAIYFGLALLYFLPAFLPGRHIYGTDYLAGGYFFHEFISHRFAQGVVPAWVPEVYGGLPLFANPGSTFYPFRFLADALFPVSRIWPTLFVIQFGLGGMGTYLLARELGTRRWVAFVAGLAFEFTGLVMSWVLAGHEGRIIVATFAPLAFYFLHAGVRTGRPAPFAGLAVAIAFPLLSFQIQTAYYLLLALALWAGFCLWHLKAFERRGAGARTVLYGLVAVAFAFVAASVVFLPFLDYVDLSPRGGPGRGYEYATSWAMPPAEVTALAAPEVAGYLDTYHGSNPMKLHTEYVGATVLLLVALGFRYARRNRYFWFFLGLGVFILTIAWGGATPLYRLYYALLPGTKKFRAPSVSLFLLSLSLVTMAALALEALARLVDAREARRPVRVRAGSAAAAPPDPELRPATWILAGMVGLGLLLGIAAAGPNANGVPGPGALAFRFALFAAAVAGVLWGWLRGGLGRTAGMALLALVTVADLWVMDRNFFRTVESPEVMFAEDDVAGFLASQRGRDRVWVLPVPAQAVYRGQINNYLMRFGIDQAAGEHGNQLQRWNQLLGAGEQSYVDYHDFLQHPAIQRAANIRWIVAGVELPPGMKAEGIELPARLREVHRGSAIVYENPDALPRAYLVPTAVTAPGETALPQMEMSDWDPARVAFVDRPVQLPAGPLAGGAAVTRYEPDRVEVRTQANRAALLVLADNYYQDWKVVVDGRPAQLLRANHTLRGVVVPAGAHRVSFTFEPKELYTGWTLYLVCMALLALYGAFLLFTWLRGRRREAEPQPE